MRERPTEVRGLSILLCGYEILKKSVSTRGRGERFVLASPICCYLLETTRGLVLIDTGVNSEIVHDQALRAEYYTSRGWIPPVVNPDH